MSAARLAAETAFSAARPPSAEQQPTVIVRRSRVVGLVAANAAIVPGVQDGSEAAGASKGPRVFRLGPNAAQSPDGGTAEARQDAVAAAAPQITVPEEFPAGRRKRRIAAEQRPGPVVQIFKAPPAARGEEPHDARRAAAAGPGAVPTRAQLATLAAMLEGVQAVLDDIQRARALRFLDGEGGSALA